MENEVRRTRAQLQAPVRGRAVVDLRAPADGVVLRRLRESESVVAAGEPILEIGNLEDIEVVTDLLSMDAVRVGPGSTAWIEGWGGGEALRARVKRVEPSGFLKVSALGVEERRVNVVLALTDTTGVPPTLADGYRVEVRVVTWSTDAAIKVPVGALFRQGDAWAVFVVDGGRARMRTVVIGQQNDREAQIERGLESGEVVVLHPPDTLRDGARVERRQE
jgi:HlyD family secretion protein